MVDVLYLVRHSKAEDSHPEGDRHRPLSREGIRRATAMVPLALARGFGADLTVTSGYRRAVQTRALFFPTAQDPGEVSTAFTPAGHPREAWEELVEWEASGARRIAVFTHNPFVTDLAAFLLGAGTDLVFHAPTVAALEFPRGLAAREGRLAWVLNP